MLTSTRARPALEEAANWLTCAECARQVACAKRTGRAAQDRFSTGPIRTNCTAGRILNPSNPNELQIQPTSSETAKNAHSPGTKVLECNSRSQGIAFISIRDPYREIRFRTGTGAANTGARHLHLAVLLL